MDRNRDKSNICPLCGGATHNYGFSWSCNDFSCRCNSETDAIGGVRIEPKWWSDGTKVYLDGNMWCAVRSDFIYLQESDVGFGESPAKAVEDLNR